MRLRMAGALALVGLLGCERPETPAACPVCPPCPAVAPTPTAEKPLADKLLSSDNGPAVSVLYHLTNQYTSVKFDHRSHVEYSDSCGSCHHHQSEVESTPACRECHGQALQNLRRPGLKGAYHRQCMGCHRETGNGPLGCEECHPKRVKADQADTPVPAPRPEERMMLGHLAREKPPLSFNHELHTEMADACRDCHHHQGEVEKTPPCRECHNTRDTKQGQQKPGLKDAYHTQCLTCHKEKFGPTECDGCHTVPEGAQKKRSPDKEKKH